MLIGIIKKNIGKRIGIVTTTIENEVYGTLGKAVNATLIEFLDGDSRKQTFDLLSYVLNKCEDRLEKILQYIVREAIPPEEKEKWLPKVHLMYEELLKRAKELDVNKIAETKAKGSSGRYKKTAYHLIRKDEKMHHRQLKRLQKKSAEPTDREILAEAAYLSMHYRSMGLGKFYLSSCDVAFSPVGDSRVVTDEIFERFKVECGWPIDIAKEIQKDL